MNRYTLRYLLAFFFVMPLALSSCIKERPDNSLDLPEGVKAIELSIKAQNQATGSTFRSAATGTTTRAYGSEPGDQYERTYATDLRENIIDNVEVFLFNTDGTLKKRFSGSQLRKEGNENSATLRMLIPNDEVSQYEGQSFRVVVVANATSTIPTDIARLTELQARTQETVGINGVPGTPQTKFLMDGAIDTQTIQWGDNFTYTVPGELPLRRALAKIRLRIKNVDVDVTENGQTVHYEMVELPKVKLVHYTEKTSLIQGAPYQTQSSEWKTSDYRTMGWYTFPGKINDTDTANPTNRFLSANLPFYTCENDWTDDSAHETYLIVEITFKAKDPQTGVYGDAKPYYYRIPVNYRLPLPGMNDEEKAGLYKVQRNHLYDIVSSIGILGSEDEGEPFEVEAFVAIQPWNEPDETDGTIRNAHFLVVKELQPLMPNMSTRQVGYLSDLPIQPKAGTTNEIEITKTVFEYYDQKGEHMVFTDNGTKVVVTKNGVNFQTYSYGQSYSDFPPFTRFGGAKVTFDETNPQNKKLTITHAIPTNYVPYEIYFRVQHVPVAGESGTPLYKDVHVTQYPPKYITGTKSPGYKPNEGDTGSYADFRFHDLLGVANTNQASGNYGAQKNDVFYKVTTVVNAGTEKIGDPTDINGRTRRDVEANKLISPEFIIASQHGLANTNTPQYEGGSMDSQNSPYWQGFGPYSSYFPDRTPYYDPSEAQYDNAFNPGVNQPISNQPNYRAYTTAENRCFNYFEGEYGMDGNYTEHYVSGVTWWNNQPIWATRTVTKTFKYKGRWRIPTAAELEYIDKIQDQAGSAVKSLLFGQYYWTAQTGKAYNFTSNILSSQSEASVRCIFDTYKVND